MTASGSADAQYRTTHLAFAPQLEDDHNARPTNILTQDLSSGTADTRYVFARLLTRTTNGDTVYDPAGLARKEKVVGLVGRPSTSLVALTLAS
jgi:hypothetical protein